MNARYEVKLDLFEGPLDLLLYLVQKAEVDIVDISVSLVTTQYLEYLDVMHELDIDVAGDYLHMAATLVRLKAREMLPGQEHEAIESEEGIYNKEQLIAQLLEYKKFKEAAGSLRASEAQQAGSYSRGTADRVEIRSDDNEPSVAGDIGLFDLISAFQNVLERAKTEEHRHVVRVEPVRIDDRIEYILGSLEEQGEVPFEQLFSDDMRRIVLVVTFMAILELIKMQEISFRQESAFSSIFVSRRDPETRDNQEPEEPEERGAS